MSNMEPVTQNRLFFAPVHMLGFLITSFVIFLYRWFAGLQYIEQAPVCWENFQWCAGLAADRSSIMGFWKRCCSSSFLIQIYEKHTVQGGCPNEIYSTYTGDVLHLLPHNLDHIDINFYLL